MNQLGRSPLLLFEPEDGARVRKRSEAALANEASQAVCAGCLDRPDLECAACGAPASIWTDTGDGRHAVAWCAACHTLLLSGRPQTAVPLDYLPLPQHAAQRRPA